MDQLPAEICQQIVAACVNGGRPALAATSRAWQFAVEMYTFRRIRLQSTELQSFEAIFTEQRRLFLSSLEYSIVLPCYSNEARGRFEREIDRTRNDEAFTAAISNLFSILSQWHGCTHASIKLEIMPITSPTDPVDRYDHILIRAIEPHDEERTAFRDLGNRRFRYSYLALLRPSELPEVACIGSLGTNRISSRAITYRAAVDIAAKLPHLRHCTCYMRDEDLRYPALRRENRLELVAALQDTLPRGPVPVVQSLCLSMDSVAIWDPAILPPSLTVSDSNADPLSQALWKATANSAYLEDLDLCGAFDESLFWPDLSQEVVEPFWQNLQRLNVHFDFTKPSGGWYFYHPSERQGFNSVAISSETAVPPGYNLSEAEDVEAAWEYSDMDHDLLCRRHRSTLKALPHDESLVPLLE